MGKSAAETVLGGAEDREALSNWTSEKTTMSATKATKATKDKSKKSPPSSNVSAPRVLVERKELQSLQSERRALFSRIDEAAAEARALRGEVQSREDQVSRARVSAAQQQE
jgi:hypothetical protein